MSEALNVDLTEEQRDLVLRGLRFVRSSVMLETVDPSPDVDDQRRSQLQEISQLVEQLNGARTARPKG